MTADLSDHGMSVRELIHPGSTTEFSNCCGDKAITNNTYQITNILILLFTNFSMLLTPQSIDTDANSFLFLGQPKQTLAVLG